MGRQKSEGARLLAGDSAACLLGDCFRQVQNPRNGNVRPGNLTWAPERGGGTGIQIDCAAGRSNGGKGMSRN